jgi:hypothetical protein
MHPIAIILTFMGLNRVAGKCRFAWAHVETMANAVWLL